MSDNGLSDTSIPLAFDAGSHSIRFGFCNDSTPGSDIPAVVGGMLNGTESDAHTNRIRESLTYRVDTNTLCVPREGKTI